MNFKLRDFAREDAQHFYDHSNNPRIRANMRDGFPLTYAECEAMISLYMAMEDEDGCVQAIDIGGHAVGSIGLFVKDGGYNAELAFWLGEKYWGRGIMTQAIDMICPYGFEHLGLSRIYAEPFTANVGSRTILKACDFRLEGLLVKAYRKEGKLVDYCIYAKLNDYGADGMADEY